MTVTREKIETPLGRRLREIRTSQGITLRQLAARTGGKVTLSAISHIETGYLHRPSFQTMVSLSQALGCDLDEFTTLLPS